MKLKNPAATAAMIERFKFNQLLIGPKNGLNRFYTTPNKFIYDPGNGTEPVFKRNGQTIYLGLELNAILESGGVGTGYDIVEFMLPPKRNDTLTVDYITV